MRFTTLLMQTKNPNFNRTMAQAARRSFAAGWESNYEPSTSIRFYRTSPLPNSRLRLPKGTVQRGRANNRKVVANFLQFA
jgi:hypothetical protein